MHTTHKHQHEFDHHKPSDKLHVVAVVSNPVRFNSRYRLFKNFVEHMKQFPTVELTIVELAFGARAFEVTEPNDPRHVQVRSNCELWHKESLINLGVRRLPSDWKYMAWVDADLSFTNFDWASETVHELQHHPVVQLFQNCADLGPDGAIMQTHTSFGMLYQNGELKVSPDYYAGKKFGHPGYAWAITREAYNAIGGFPDFAILGSGDHHMASAFIGNVGASIHKDMHQNYRTLWTTFQDRCEKHIQHNVGFVHGTILHHFHGKKKTRYYVERWKTLIDHKYDPLADIQHDWQGLVTLSGNKPGLRDDLIRYFRSRLEDSTDTE
jgi:hypothetical protein